MTAESFVEQEDAKAKLWMPIYVGDYLRDTQGLNAEEHGAYFKLLLALWMNGGFLENDPRRNARIACVDFDRWPVVWGGIAKFFRVEPTRIWQKRNLEELEKAAEQRRKNLERSQAANAAKRAKRTGPGPAQAPADQAGDRQGDLRGDLKETSKETSKVTPSPSPSPSPSEAPTQGGSGAPPGVSKGYNGIPGDSHALLVAFGCEWRDVHGSWWKPEGDAERITREFWDQFDKLPPEEAKAQKADAVNRIRRYLADKDPRLVSRKHPLRWFLERWNALGGGGGEQAAKNYREVPASFPRAKQLP